MAVDRNTIRIKGIKGTEDPKTAALLERLGKWVVKLAEFEHNQSGGTLSAQDMERHINEHVAAILLERGIISDRGMGGSLKFHVTDSDFGYKAIPENPQDVIIDPRRLEAWLTEREADLSYKQYKTPSTATAGGSISHTALQQQVDPRSV